eukprot:755677-Hanusia_phi.AAC.4
MAVLMQELQNAIHSSEKKSKYSWRCLICFCLTETQDGTFSLDERQCCHEQVAEAGQRSSIDVSAQTNRRVR